MRILIIEDDAASMKLAHVILAHEGHKVSEAEEALKALKIIKQKKPHVILMDLALPGIDGLELTRKLKKDPQTRRIPVIAVTAHPNRFSREESLEAGCDAYIVKPINTRTFSKEVGEVVSRKK